MADIKTSNSTYSVGTIDTATLVIALVDDIKAQQWNGAATAIIGIETILGIGTTLKGNKLDLVERLGQSLNADGKLKASADAHETGAVPVLAGGTGLSSIGQGKKVHGSGSTQMQELDPFRQTVLTAASGVFVVPSGVIQLYVELIGAAGGSGGGGGGGSGDGAFSGGNGGAGARGMNGGYVSGLITTSPGATFSYTVGSGGSGGSGGAGASGTSNPGSTGSTGGTGGSTTFGPSYTSNGGPGGAGGGGGGGGGPVVAGAHAANSVSELADHATATGPANSLVIRGRGMAGRGAGGSGGVGTTGSGVSGAAGATGEAGRIVVWY